MGKKLNAERKRARLAGEPRVSVRQRARKAQKNVEPNGRRYGGGVEKRIERMKPEEPDRLLRDDSGG